jgi:uncharacterized protein YyaL (SSP411 family)
MSAEKERPLSLKNYINTLKKELEFAKASFWKETRSAQENFHKTMISAMRDYEKVEYSKKREPGSLVEATKCLNDSYDKAYGAFGNATKEALEQFEKSIEDLIGA